MGDKKSVAPDTLYLREGHFRTAKGDLRTSQDAEIKSGELKIAPRSYLRTGTKINAYGQLWYSATANGGYASTSLYLKKGDFRTFQGNIEAGKDLYAHKELGTLKAGKAHIKTSFSCQKCSFGKIYILPHTVGKTPTKVAADSKEPGSHDKAIQNMPSGALVLL